MSDFIQEQITKGLTNHDAQVTADNLPVEACMNRIVAELARYKAYEKAKKEADAILQMPISNFRPQKPKYDIVGLVQAEEA